MACSSAQYMKKYRAEKGIYKRFYIDVKDSDSIIHDKFEKARSLIGSSTHDVVVTKADVMNKLLDCFLSSDMNENSTQNDSNKNSSYIWI